MLLSVGACHDHLLAHIFTEGAALQNVDDTACYSNIFYLKMYINDNVLNLDIFGWISVKWYSIIFFWKSIKLIKATILLCNICVISPSSYVSGYCPTHRMQVKINF